MHKKLFGIIGSVIMTISFAAMTIMPVYAEGEGENLVEDATFESICKQMGVAGTSYEFYPACAESPSECASVKKTDTVEKIDYYNTPLNCMFLEEPIGGDAGYDLYKIECYPNPTLESQQVCEYILWYGEAITPTTAEGHSVRGPVQAILTYEEGKDYQGPFSLLYNYIGLIYQYLSGVIVGFVVLISIIGGIRMTTSAGNSEAFSAGRKMIIKALTGMVLWFLASLILYTINPTFFAF